MQELEQRRLAPQVFSVATSWPEAAVARLPRAVYWVWDSPLRAVASAFLLLAVAILAAKNQHAVVGISYGPAVIAVRSIVPMTAAFVVLLCLYRPWPGFLAAVALTPVWDTSQTEIMLGQVQVILQTVFAVALIFGCVLQYATARHNRVLLDLLASKSQSKDLIRGRTAVRGLSHRYSSYMFAQVGATAFVAFAILSTLASRDLANSATVLLHGILEPFAMGAILIWLRPSRRGLMLAAAALGIGIALGTAINLMQAFDQFKTPAMVLSNRLVFAFPTYNNVGNFAIIAALVVPLLAGLIAGRRRLRISDPLAAVLGVVLVLDLTGLFFSLSKSAWLSATVGLVVLLLMVLRTWRTRLSVLGAAAILSAVLIPWPALVLQVSPPLNNAYRTAVVSLVGEARFDSWNPATLAGHGSMVERFYAVEGGVKMALDRPLLGVGLDEFGNYYLWHGYRPEGAKDTLDHAHSLLPEVAAELGLPALTFLVVIITAAMWAMWRSYRTARDQATRILAATLLAAIGTWLLAATAFGVDIYRQVRDQSSDVVAAAVLIAMAVALARLVTAENRPPDDSRFGAV